MKGAGTTALAPAKLLSDWEKATFNTISVRDDFAADHPPSSSASRASWRASTRTTSTMGLRLGRVGKSRRR